MGRRWRALAVLASMLMTVAVGVVPQGASARGGAAIAPQPREACFAATNHCAQRAFLDYWRNSGGIEILGLPIDQVRRYPDGIIRQFYERAILEWHPENDPQYQVLITRLGAALIDGSPRTAQPPAPCSANCTIFRETNHTLRGAFRDYWIGNGGLAVFGLPLTEEFTEISAIDGKPYTVQYFERNRFEYHPEQTPRYRVLLGLLGREALNVLGTDVTDLPIAEVDDYGESGNYRGLVILPSTGYVGASFAIIGLGLRPYTAHRVVIVQFTPPGTPEGRRVAELVADTDAGGRFDLTLDSTRIPPGKYTVAVFERPTGAGVLQGTFDLSAR